MITNLREAKSNLSHLVQLAAEGEDIVITVRGRPTAVDRCRQPKDTQHHERGAWAGELSAASRERTSELLGPRRRSHFTSSFWDELARSDPESWPTRIYWDTSALAWGLRAARIQTLSPADDFPHAGTAAENRGH